MRFIFTNRLTIVAAGAVALALVARGVRGADAPATPPVGVTETFVPPIFTEDFESGVLDTKVWDLRVAATTPANRPAARGAAPGAAQPAGAAPAPAPAAAAATPPPPGTQPIDVAADTVFTIEHDTVAHGKNALHVHYPGVLRSYSFIVAKNIPAALKDHFFGRAYVMFPKPTPAGHALMITIGGPGYPISNFLEIGAQQGQLSYQQNGADVPRAETFLPGAKKSYPIGKWFCMEWEFNDNPDSITLWIDGEKVASGKLNYKGVGDHLIKGFTDFAFGFRAWSQVPGGFDVYYDDLALGTGRIGPVK